MKPTSRTEIRVLRSDLRVTEIHESPIAPLAEGEVLLRVDKFALTANNVTYGFAGDLIGYWRFFPTGEPWGILPVWGFGDVVASRCPEVHEGERLWGFLPMASHVVLQPGNLKPDAFDDVAAHRASLPGIYNRYQRTAQDPPEMQALEDARCLLVPLFTTSYVIHDFLADNAWFGARQIVILSASSKTGFGLAHLVAHDPAKPVRVVGVTSPGNVAFVQSLGTCDSVLTYDSLQTIDASLPTIVVDMAGSGAVLAAVHEHVRDNVVYSCSVGATHWTDAGTPRGLPGAAPTFFFAPGQITKRDHDWGPGEILRRAFAASAAIAGASAGVLHIEHVRGAASVKRELDDMVAGKTAPHRGLMLGL